MKKLAILLSISIFISCTFTKKEKEQPQATTTQPQTTTEPQTPEQPPITTTSAPPIVVNDGQQPPVALPQKKPPQQPPIVLPIPVPPKIDSPKLMTYPVVKPVMKAKEGIGAKTGEMLVRPPKLDTISVH